MRLITKRMTLHDRNAAMVGFLPMVLQLEAALLAQIERMHVVPPCEGTVITYAYCVTKFAMMSTS